MLCEWMRLLFVCLVRVSTLLMRRSERRAYLGLVGGTTFVAARRRSHFGAEQLSHLGLAHRVQRLQSTHPSRVKHPEKRAGSINKQHSFYMLA